MDIGAVEVQAGGVGTHLELQGPASVYLASVMSWNATVLDDNNVPAVNFSGPVIMSVAAGPGNFASSSTTVANAVYGSAAFTNLTLDTPGYYNVQASFGNSTVMVAVGRHGASCNWCFSRNRQPHDVVAPGSIGVIQVAVEDSFGNVITGDNDPVTLALQNYTPVGQGSTVVPAPFSNGQLAITVAAVNGIATFNNLSVDVADIGFSLDQLQAGADGVSANSDLFNVTPAGARHLVFGPQPSNVTAGQPMSPDVSVAIEDAYGNIVTSGPIANGGNVVLTLVTPNLVPFNHLQFTLAAHQGVATFDDLVLNVPAGSYSFFVVVPGVPAGLTVFLSFTVAANPLVFRAGPLVQAKSGFSIGAGGGTINVVHEDANGLPLSGDNEPITLTLLDVPGIGGLASANPRVCEWHADSLTVSAQNGSAVFPAGELAVNEVAMPVEPAGSPPSYYVLQASADGLAAESIRFTVIPDLPHLVFTQQPSNVTAGQAMSPNPSLAVEDACGKIVTSLSGNGVRLALFNAFPATSAPVANFSATTKQGVATFNNLVIKGTVPAGSYVFGASVDRVVTNQGGIFLLSNTFTVSPADPVVGPSQRAVVNTKYATPFFAKVTDLAGNPLAGMVVTFTAPASGAGGTFAGLRTVTERTNAAGIATAPAFTANTKAGAFVVTVGFNGDAAPETIALTNLAGPPTHLTIVSGTLQSATVNTTFNKAIAFAVKDIFGNPVSGASVTFTAPTSGPSGAFAGAHTTTILTDAAGVATAPTFTANTTAGAFVMTVSQPASSSPPARQRIIHLTNCRPVGLSRRLSKATPRPPLPIPTLPCPWKWSSRTPSATPSAAPG